MLIGLGIVSKVKFLSLKHKTPSSFLVVFDTITENPKNLGACLFLAPQGKLSVLCWINIRFIFRIFPRSTLHSAIDLPLSDIVHSPPEAVRLDFRPSTARCAPQSSISFFQGYLSHACLFKAMFSVTY